MKKNIRINVDYSTKRLVVFSGVAHHNFYSGFVAHRGFVREIDIWARIFKEVLVITRPGTAPTLSDEVPYAEKNISIYCLPAPQNTDGFFGKAKLILYAPTWVWLSIRRLTGEDVLMARGPDSIGFLGWLVSRFTKLPRFAKYADQWEKFKDEPVGYRFQKSFYRAKNFGGPVMIYGAKDPFRPHLTPFFTSGISEYEWVQAGKQIENRNRPPPFQLLFVGRFVFFKGTDILLDALNILNESRNDLILHLVGDGPEKKKIQEKIAREHLNNVNLHGWLGPDDLYHKYVQAHIFVHPSRKEGYGKVLLEAMSYGLPIVGADVGVSIELVERNRCGILFQSGDATHLADQINFMLSNNALRQEFGSNGRNISKNMLLENLEKRYRLFVLEKLSLS